MVNIPNREVDKNSLKKSGSVGGLELVSIREKSMAQKVVYISKILTRPKTDPMTAAASAVIGRQQNGANGIEIFKYNDKVRYTLDSFYQTCWDSFDKITYERDLPQKRQLINNELLYNNRFIINNQNETLKTQIVLTRNNIFRVGDLTKRNLSNAIKTRIGNIKKLLPPEWNDPTEIGPNPKEYIKIRENKIKLRKITTGVCYKYFVSKLKPNDKYKDKWNNLFNPEPIDWKEIWNTLKLINNDQVRSCVWSQLRLNFWTPFLEKHQWKNNDQSGKCKLCDVCQNDQFHLLKDCETVIELWDELRHLLTSLVPINIGVREMCFGLEGRGLNYKLRNYISFSLRAAIHRCRNYDFHNRLSAKSKILNTLKHELRTDLMIKYEKSVKINEERLFEKRFLIKNVLGNIAEKNLIFNAFLE